MKHTQFQRMAALFVQLFVLSCVLNTIPADADPLAWQHSSSSFVDELRELGVTAPIRTDAEATAMASADFGNISDAAARAPAAVLYPMCPEDIAALLRASYMFPSSPPFPVSARGCGHSTHGQASAPDGVVVDMPSLGRLVGSTRISVSVDGRYIDAGGEQLWVDVLHAALVHGLTPMSWTDYLYLTVGGTLSNAGISGQAFRHGPQISNVQELDVITGSGQMVTCSKEKDADLFDAVLGGLGQFGVITRARIPLAPAPARVRRVQFLYTSAAALTGDQERLIDERRGGALSGLMDYVEGSVLADKQGVSNWRPSSPGFSEADSARVVALAEEAGGVLYILEGALYYGGAGGMSASDVDKSVEVLLQELGYARGFAFVYDVSYVGFLDRGHGGEVELRQKDLWDVSHPWLNLFLPRSRILDFAAGVFHGILRRHPTTGAINGPILIYPMNRNKWDGETSAVIPEDDNEEVMYTVGILPTAAADGSNLAQLEEQNEEIMRFCEEAGIECRQYLAYYADQAGWEKKHFGAARWARFVERKRKYDPMAILSRGQRIFTSPLLA